MFWARSSRGTAVALGAVPIGQVTKVVSETLKVAVSDWDRGA